MLDRRLLREDPDAVKTGVANKNVNVDVDRLVELDRRLLDNIQRSDELKHERNVQSESIAQRKRSGEPVDDIHTAMKELSSQIKALEAEYREAEEELEAEMLTVPNLPHHSVPVGKDETANRVVRNWGNQAEPFEDQLPHWDMGEKLGILDLEGGRKVSGRGFVAMRGDGALLTRALINLFLDIHHDQGYTEVTVPYLVHRDSMIGTGQLPKMEDDMYHTAADDLFLIPTAEVSVTNLLRESHQEYDDLPIKFTAYSPCFRREAGSHGADTRGLLRVHQFDKVEMVKFVKPEESYNELESLTKDATDCLEALELPYRVIELCTGDLSFGAAKCYDLEVYSPAADKWLEVSSCSNFEAFQARRADIRLKKNKVTKEKFVHTLNGSGLALPRIIAAILEIYQTPTGRVAIPKVLQPYMRGQEFLG